MDNELSEFEAKKLQAMARIRNGATHGREFNYTKQQVGEMIRDVENTLNRILGFR